MRADAEHIVTRYLHPFQPNMAVRFSCPCCGYLTLDSRGEHDICVLCNWEDDGQDDPLADEVWGGPNARYSLTEARQNFLKYRVMYAPGRDQRISQGDSAVEFETKGLLMNVLEQIKSLGADQSPALEREVFRLQAILSAESERQIREYEASLGKEV